MERKAFKNPHSGKIDTIFNYHLPESNLVFYKNTTSIFFKSALIQDKNIKLKDGIQIGSTKADFLKKLKLPGDVKSDTILISDDEDFTRHRFYFKKNKLFKIELDSGMD